MWGAPYGSGHNFGLNLLKEGLSVRLGTVRIKNPKLSRINCKLQLYRLWFNPTWTLNSFSVKGCSHMVTTCAHVPQLLNLFYHTHQV